MNENEKITSAKIIEEQEQLKAKYETEIKAVQQANLSLQNTLLKKDDEIFELQKSQTSLTKDRDEWKSEARRNRRIEQEQKQTKEQNDFLTEFAKLQEAKLKGGRP
jgi:peptidoglycan hydrolase CwlO-like protein